MKTHACLTRLFALVVVYLLLASTAYAAGIKVVPSTDRVSPGESFYVDIVAENIPSEGLGTVQFELKVDAPDSIVTGVTDLNQAGDANVYVASPLLIGEPTATRSGLGDLFLDLYQGSNGILVMDNETFSAGDALYTYAHTNGANLPSGSGSVARFRIKVGSQVAAEDIRISLSNVMLLDGGAEYPLDYNIGATVTLRCSVEVPDLSGMTLAEAQDALANLELTSGNIYEISNPGSVRPLGVVLEQSVAAGTFAECGSTIDLAINQAPADVTGLSAVDLAGDDTGKVLLNWSPSPSSDVSGYRIYNSGTLLAEIDVSQGGTATVGSLPIGSVVTLKVTALDEYGNESAGTTVNVTALDDVPPVISFNNVADGAYYASSVHPQLETSENHPAGLTTTLNGGTYDWSPISADGVYTLVVTMTDASGNSSTESVGFIVDGTAPVISVPNLVEGGYMNAALTPEINIEDLAGDDQQTVVTLNGQPYVPGTPIEGEGPQTLVISATDKAGNQSTLTVSFIIDRIAPTIAVDAVTDGAYYKAGVTPQIDIVDASPVESTITLNGNPYLSGTAIDAEGASQLVIFARDAAGNEVSQSIHFTIDLTAPVIDVAQVTEGVYYNKEVVPTVVVTDAALAESSLTLNGVPFVSGTPVNDEGVYTLVATARDLADNETGMTVNFTIDLTPPVIQVTGVADGALVNVDVTPVVSITELNPAESSLTLNGNPFVSGTTLGEEAAYQLAAHAVDLAGNRAEVVYAFLIDKTAPVSGLDLGTPKFEAGGVLYAAGSATVTLHAEDGGPAPSNVAQIGYALDGSEPWTVYADRFDLSSLSEGVHSLAYRATDRAGNREADHALHMTIDNSSPETTLAVEGVQFDGGDSLFVTGATGFTLTSVDSYSGVAATDYRIDDGEWAAYAPFTVSGDGVHVITYRGTDNLGHVESAKSFTVTVDDSAPVTTVTVGEPQFTAGDTLYVTSATEISLTAIDAVSGVAATEYRLDGGAWQSYEPFRLPEAGSHLIEYRSRDRLGNLEDIQTLSLVVDNTPPTAAIATGQPQFAGENSLYVTGATLFTVSAEDALCGVDLIEYRVDEGAWTEFAPFAVTGEGQHTIAYRAVDNLGNLAAAQTLAVTVDNTAPVSTVEVGQPQYSLDGTLHISSISEIRLDASDNLAGVGTVEYSFDAGDWRTFAGGLTTAGLEDGPHAIAYRATDRVGNLEGEHTLNLVVDNTAPETAIALEGAQYVAADGSHFATGKTIFTLAANDALVGVAVTEYRIDGGEWTAYAPFSLNGEGEHRIEYRSSDHLGNLELIRLLIVTIDDSPPATLAISGHPKHTDGQSLFVTGTTPISLTAEDVLVGVAATQYRIDEGEWQAYDAAFTLVDLADGSHTVGYRSTDHLGNTEEVRVLSVTVDNTAPVSSLVCGQPQFTSEDGILYVTGNALFTIDAIDQHAGVALTEYRIDGGTWTPYAPFNILAAGEHVIAYRSHDHLGNIEIAKSLVLTVDNAAPVTQIDANLPQYTDANGLLYVTAATGFTLTVTDDFSGVSQTRYRIDNGDWVAGTQFNIPVDGPHQVDFQSSDRVGNLEEIRSLQVVVDNQPPVTGMTIDAPKYVAVDGTTYVTSASIITLDATDNLVGVSTTEYRLNGGDWMASTSFTIGAEGEHLIEYRSTDHLGNAEEIRAMNVIVDNTAPITGIAFENQSFIDGDRLLLTAASKVILSATDDLSGVAWTYYRFDEEVDWRPYTGDIQITDLAYGPHVMHFYTEDHVDNAEAPQSVDFTLVGAEVKIELLNRPRVLVWTDDPAAKKGWHGHSSPSYTLDEIRNLIAQAMDAADAYVELVTEEDDFRENFQSGIFNVVMVLSQKERMDNEFLRELRDAVKQGRIGLLISSWGNNVHPTLQDMFGVRFVGSLPMNEDQRELQLFDSDVAQSAVLTADGRILKTLLDGGVLAGMIPGESRCQGVRGLSFTYPEALAADDRITVSVYRPKGRKLGLVDQEQMVIAVLPSEGINNFTGNPAGDLAIGSADTEGLSFSLTGPYGYLGSDYRLEVRIEHADGTIVESGLIPVSPTCGAHLWEGMTIGPFEVNEVEEDRVQISPDLPAVVLNQFGEGRTVFLAYDILESAMKDESGTHAGLLGNSANYLIPESTGPEPAGIGLIQTTVSFEGSAMDVIAIDTLDSALTHLSLFGLKEPPLEYRFSLEDGTQASYRYFVRFPDQIGDYAKQTELLLELDGTAISYDTYEHIFTVPTDSTELLQQALSMVEEVNTQNPRDRRLLERIRSDLEAIGNMRKTTISDYEKVIREVDEVIQQIEKLHFDTEDLQGVLARYLRIMQTLKLDAEDASLSGNHGHGAGWWRPGKRECYGPVPIDADKRQQGSTFWK